MVRTRTIITLLTALFVESRQEAFRQAVDTLSLSSKVVRTASFTTGFRDGIWRNPTLYYYYIPYTRARLSVNGVCHNKGRASLKQEDDRGTHIGVDVSSFVTLSERDRVFGSAGCKSEKQGNVLQNENIDWKLIAPYVTDDSIGGFLKGGAYYFNGGYASESGSWTWGITGGYRASHSYRDKDPRPRNTASDLSLASGTGYRPRIYRLGVPADFRPYQQKSEISFLVDKGSTSVYHMLGLGMDYVCFAGNQTGTKHQDTRWGGSMGVLPADTEKGISTTTSIDRMSVDKRLSNANNLILSELDTVDLEGNVIWMRELQQIEHLAVRLDTDYTARKGMENIYGEAGGSSYRTLISTSPGMKITNSRIVVSDLWEKLLTDKGVWGGAIAPDIAYRRLETDYNAVSRLVRLSILEGSLRVRLRYQERQLRPITGVNGGYYADLLAEYSLPGLDAARPLARTLLASINYLSDSYNVVGVRL